VNYRLQRTWYKTDVNDDDPDYVGSFSDPIPDPESHDSVIVDVDWSERGLVQVTYLTQTGW
jgi:hypothetical protein